MANTQNTITLQVKVGVSPLGASGNEVKDAVTAALTNLNVCPPAYSVNVELVDEKLETI
jgi:hypothetical protein